MKAGTKLAETGVMVEHLEANGGGQYLRKVTSTVALGQARQKVKTSCCVAGGGLVSARPWAASWR